MDLQIATKIKMYLMDLYSLNIYSDLYENPLFHTYHKCKQMCCMQQSFFLNETEQLYLAFMVLQNHIKN